jgi:hypothetical protein
MKKLIFTTFIILGLASCNDYLDINTNPNTIAEEQLNPSLIFPGAEMNLAASYGNFLRITGGYFAQQYSQTFGTSNYLDYSQFTMSATRSSSTYSQLSTRCLKNLESVRNLAKETDDAGSYLAATVLRAFAFSVLVDAYGETPYTEALDADNISPKFDEGQTVYEGLLAEIDAALDGVSSSTTVCSNFLYGTSTAGEWIQLANALKLKLLMRMSGVKDVSAQVAALIAENNFPTADVSWDDCWADETGKANPFYQEEYATYFGSTQVNVIANIALVATMQASGDARLQKAFAANSSGNYTGGVSGTNYKAPGTYTANFWNRPVFKYNMPVYLITVAETEFFLAEYYARYGSAAQAASHYEAAVEASFATVGASGADAVLAAYPYSNSDYRRVIGIQKWVALGCINNFEAWCEVRRLKYPAFGTVTGDNLYNIDTDTYSPDLYVPGTLYTPIKYESQVGAGKLLQRYPYAEAATSRNKNAPATKPLSEPVFWAK